MCIYIYIYIYTHTYYSVYTVTHYVTLYGGVSNSQQVLTLIKIILTKFPNLSVGGGNLLVCSTNVRCVSRSNRGGKCFEAYIYPCGVLRKSFDSECQMGWSNRGGKRLLRLRSNPTTRARMCGFPHDQTGIPGCFEHIISYKCAFR